jgi:hypothetical protein
MAAIFFPFQNFPTTPRDIFRLRPLAIAAILSSPDYRSPDMAERPLFIPQSHGPILVRTQMVAFTWHSGFAVTQKRKSIRSLHDTAVAAGHCRNPLEVSTRSADPLGVALSAFKLTALRDCQGRAASVETAWRCSRVFEQGGPFTDLLFAAPQQAKEDSRSGESGALVRFDWLGDAWDPEPHSGLYDWLYLNALHREPALAEQAQAYDAFTDIDFNPDRSCQAYALALYCALAGRGLLPKALASKQSFLRVLSAG